MYAHLILANNYSSHQQPHCSLFAKHTTLSITLMIISLNFNSSFIHLLHTNRYKEKDERRRRRVDINRL